MTDRGGIDDLDRRLITELLADPRASLTALGKQIGVSGTTVATRMERLRDDDLLRIEARPNLQRFGITRAIWGAVQIEASSPAGIQTLLTNSPYVVRIDELTGEFSLSFLAVFPSDEALGGFLRQIQGSRDVRRFSVHHVLATVKDSSGWEVVFTNVDESSTGTYEIAPGVQVPSHLALHVATAASWLAALVEGDFERVTELSAPDIVYRVVRPRATAATYEGIDEVARAAQTAKEAYVRFRYRIVNVLEAEPPYTVVIDALSPTEDADGTQFTAFSRFAYALEDGKVKLAASIGQVDLQDLPNLAELDSRVRSLDGR